jgi:hypothetical protein
MRDSFNELRQNGLFLDLELVPSKSEEGSQRNLLAHRVFMAANMPHVRESLAANMAESVPGTDGIYRIRYPYSSFVLRMVIGK